MHTSSPVTSSVPLEVNLPGESTSSVHQGLSLPWSTHTVTPPLRSTAQNTSFASDNPNFQSVLEESKESLVASNLPQEDRREGDKDEADKAPADFGNI